MIQQTSRIMFKKYYYQTSGKEYANDLAKLMEYLDLQVYDTITIGALGFNKIRRTEGKAVSFMFNAAQDGAFSVSTKTNQKKHITEKIPVSATTDIIQSFPSSKASRRIEHQIRIQSTQ